MLSCAEPKGLNLPVKAAQLEVLQASSEITHSLPCNYARIIARACYVCLTSNAAAYLACL